MNIQKVNTRIRDIVRQADLSACNDLDDTYIVHINELEKLAELIVKECADLVDRAISDGGVDGRVVKEHFGVEERTN